MTTFEAVHSAGLIRSGESDHVARWRWRTPMIVFTAAFAGYVTVAGLLVHANVVFGDAISRVASAYYVLYSRDPHLSAIGFVWNPLPSLVTIPLLPLKSIFPGLVSDAFAGCLQSAASMAAAVVILHGCLRKLGVRPRSSVVLAGLFAVQPMIVLYGANGESDAMMLCWLLLATSGLISWRNEGRPGSLVVCGLALGLAYMTRYEALAAGAAVAAVVFVLVFRSSGPGIRNRLHASATDVVLAIGPLVFAFVLWALTSKIIVGQWFATFESIYGNSAQVARQREFILAATGESPVATLSYFFRQGLVLAPLCGVLALVALVLHRRRLGGLAAAIAPLGASVAFAAFALLTHSTFGWLRFQLALIPLTVILGAFVIAGVRGRKRPVWGRRRGVDGLVTSLVAICVVASVGTQAVGMTDVSSGLAREEAPVLSALIFPDRAASDPNALAQFVNERQIATEIDAMGLPDGAVLVDTAAGFPVVLASSHPRQFAITSDTDFPAALRRPSTHGIRYILVPSEDSIDAINVVWPSLYEDGAGFSHLVKEWQGLASRHYPSWRLYRVTS